MKSKEGFIVLISAINKEIDFFFDKLLYELEITKMESLYLRIIYENPGITQYQISQKRKIEKSLVTKYISNLEDKGLIEKRQLDKRKKGLYILQDGLNAIKYIDSFTPKLQEKFKDLFTKEEFEIFINSLRKLKIKLEDINERGNI